MGCKRSPGERVMTPDVSGRRAVQFGGLASAVELGRDVVPNQQSGGGVLLSSPAGV